MVSRQLIPTVTRDRGWVSRILSEFSSRCRKVVEHPGARCLKGW